MIILACMPYPSNSHQPCRLSVFIRAMYFPPFDGAAMLVNGRQMPVESLEADGHAVQAQIKPMFFLTVS